MKILIVEDERLLAESVKTLLEAKGFQVEVVFDGEDGVAYAQMGIYDLLILDMMVPKMDGMAVIRQVRSNHCSASILILTAGTTVEDRIQALNAGADYYLTKPFDSRELLACVNALIRRQGGQVDELRYGDTTLDFVYQYADLWREKHTPKRKKKPGTKFLTLSKIITMQS